MISARVLEAESQGALVIRAPQMGTIAVSGRDRQSWLNGLVTSNLADLAPGGASYGLVLVKIGRILADVWIVPTGDRLLLGVPRDRIALLAEHFEKYLMMEDASQVDVSAEFAWVLVRGPRAAEVLADVPQRHGGFGGVVAGIASMGAAAVPANRLDEMVVDMLRQGPSYGFAVAEASEEEWDALRVERFVPRFGVDFADKNYPQEAALEKIAVSFNKGCYLGQEVVCRLEMRGHVIKKIVPVRLTGHGAPPSGTEVRSPEGKVLGVVSSSTVIEGGAMAIAMLRLDATDPGTKVDIAGREATVQSPP